MRYGRLNLVPVGWSRRFVIGCASDTRNTHLRDRAPRVGEALSLSSLQITPRVMHSVFEFSGVAPLSEALISAARFFCPRKLRLPPNYLRERGGGSRRREYPTLCAALFLVSSVKILLIDSQHLVRQALCERGVCECIYEV